MLPILELKPSPQKSSNKSDTHISTLTNDTKEEVQDFASILNALAQPTSKKSSKFQSISTQQNAHISNKQPTQFLKSLENKYNFTKDFKLQHSTSLKSAKDLLEFSKSQKQSKTLRDLSQITKDLQLNLKNISAQIQIVELNNEIPLDSKIQSPLHNLPKQTNKNPSKSNLLFNPSLEEKTQYSTPKTTNKNEKPTKSINPPLKEKDIQNSKDLKNVQNLQAFKEPQAAKKDFPVSTQKMETKLPKIESKTQEIKATKDTQKEQKIAPKEIQEIKETKGIKLEQQITPNTHQNNKEEVDKITQNTSKLETKAETKIQIQNLASKPQAQTEIQTETKTQPKADIKNQLPIKSNAKKQANTTEKQSLLNPHKESPTNQQNITQQTPINAFNASQKEQILQSSLEQTTKEEIFLDNLLTAHTKQHIPSKEPPKDKEIQKEKEKLHWENHSSGIQSIREIRPNIQNTFTHFSDRLKEAIANYRPPVTKISLELNPQNLGSVELTIAKNGDKLSVQISSNQNALQLIMQNAQDFKNALGNLGFQNIEMDFKDNQGNFLGNGNFNDSNNNQQGRFHQGQQNAQNFEQNPQQNQQTTENWNENSLHIYKEANNPYARVALVNISFSYDA